MNTTGYMAHNGIEVIKQDKDYGETRVSLTPQSMNPLSYAHGGLYFSLADSAAGVASWTENQVYVTLNATIDFMIPVQTGSLTAKATAISRSGKICVVNVGIYDDNDTLVNQGTYTMYLVHES